MKYFISRQENLVVQRTTVRYNRCDFSYRADAHTLGAIDEKSCNYRAGYRF